MLNPNSFENINEILSNLGKRAGINQLNEESEQPGVGHFRE